MLKEVNFDAGCAQQKLDELGRFLQDQEFFSETAIVTKFKEWVHLSSFIGSLNAGLWRPDRYKFEFHIQGCFQSRPGRW